MTSSVDIAERANASALPRSVVASAALALLVTAFVSLAWLSAKATIPAWAFIVLFVSAWASYAITFLTWLPSRALLTAAIAAAVAVRVAGVLAVPIYEDDWARYLWDGHRLLEDGTPYLRAPAEYFERETDPNWAEVLEQVNNPQVPTIYAPTLQLIFALASLVSPASIWVLKLLLVGFDVLLWAIISRLKGAETGLRYALCPLVIFEVSFNAHADIIGAALVVACYALIAQSHRVVGGVAFALALASKPLAIVIAPALLNRRWYVTAIASALTLAVLYLPFVASGATELAGVAAFSQWWEFNSLGFAVLKETIGDPHARAIGLALGLALTGTLISRWLLRDRQTIPPVDLWVLALLAFAPVINPWYLLWAVPWACLRPNPFTWSMLPAVSIAYLTTGVLGVESDSFHNHLWWVRPLEVGTAVAIFLGLQSRSFVSTSATP